NEAELAPGLVHHHFADREELFSELVRSLYTRFRTSLNAADLAERLNAALELRGPRGVRAARAWVGLFAEGVRSASVREAVSRVIDGEFVAVQRQLEKAGVAEPGPMAAGLVSLVLGALVFGAFAPSRARGFAAPFARRVLAAMG
ncbi:MAG: hypothetical protein AAFX94_02265, partial [Myxococcota bacterium]